MVNVQRLRGKQLLCRAGRHTLLTDRKIEDGGTEAGCTSGELLLLAIGSCAAGSARTFLELKGLPAEDLSIEVNFTPSVTVGARDMIVIEISLPSQLWHDHTDAIKEAAVSGGVVSRLMLGSQIEIRARPVQTSEPSGRERKIDD